MGLSRCTKTRLSFTHTKLPEDQIWNLIKKKKKCHSGLLGFFPAGQVKGVSDQLRPRYPLLSSENHLGAPHLHLLGQSRALWASCCLSAHSNLPLTVTKPLMLCTPAHCNRTPSESMVQLFIRENDCGSHVTGDQTSSPLVHFVPSEFRSYFNF